MDRVHYAGDSVLTGTNIAKALLEYAKALAEKDASDTVEIPTRDENGSVGRSTILIGPASQLIADSEDSDADEITDPGLVEHLARKTARLRQPDIASPVFDGTEQPPSMLDEY
jgi:hypothetical protein